MHKLNKNSLKSGTPAAVGGSKAKGLLVLSLVIILLATLVVSGQQEGSMTKKDKDIVVTDRFENAMQAKEPSFKLVSKATRKNENENYVLQGWKNDTELVSATTYELASVGDAEVLLKRSLDAPLSVPDQIIKLTRLGDEAYLFVNALYGKAGKTSLLLRKGNIVINMRASSTSVALRFAKHMADEIGKQ